jgi:DHA1 family multidrug resistance protein-like MFS transporter
LAYTEERANWREIIDNKFPPAYNDSTTRVEWYSEDDEESPHNWSLKKKAFILGVIGAYSFVVYMSAPIYAPSEDSFVEEYGVSEAKASLGLVPYV